MNLATIEGGGPDGTLVVVSDDQRRMLLPADGPRNLREALETWETSRASLYAAAVALSEPGIGYPFEESFCLSPLPRTFLWAEGSCYLSHMERIRGSRGQSLPPDHREAPLIYQSGGDANLRPLCDVELVDPTWDLDVEGTVVVYIDHIPRGASPDEAAAKIRLVGIANDFTYRGLIAKEYARGAGFFRSKPARSFAPIVVETRDLGASWSNGWISGEMHTTINQRLIGRPQADKDLQFSIGELLSYLALTRPLSAGSIVGTGTVSNHEAPDGLGCIAEERAEQLMASGTMTTSFLQAGDNLEIAFEVEGRRPFGAIRHRIVRLPKAADTTAA